MLENRAESPSRVTLYTPVDWTVSSTVGGHEQRQNPVRRISVEPHVGDHVAALVLLSSVVLLMNSTIASAVS